MLLFSSQDFTGHEEIIYMREISFALTSLHVSLSIYRSILRSCDHKFVFRFWAHRQRVAVVDVIVTRKRVTSQNCHKSKAKSLFVGTWTFSLRTEKIPRQIIFISIKFFEALYINENFQLKYSRFKSSQSKNKHNKIIHHFHLIPFTGLNRRTETNDIYCKLKIKGDLWSNSWNS